MQCSNHLKQMGLGFHLHHDAHKCLPSGGLGPSVAGGRTMNGGVPAIYDSQRWGWCYQILPYIEQTNLYNLPAGTAQDAVIIATPVPILYCPSKGRRQVVSGTAVQDYLGNGGSYGHWSSTTAPTNSLDGPLTPSTGPVVDFGRIKDGLSSTLLIGEKWLYPQWYNDRTTGGGTCIDNEGWCNGWDNDGIGMSGTQNWNPPMPPNITISSYKTVTPMPDAQLAWSCGLVFGGPHSGGILGVLADGSVHNISFNVDPTAWRNFCAINDGFTLAPGTFQ
jgi:hypothetical protein